MKQTAKPVIFLLSAALSLTACNNSGTTTTTSVTDSIAAKTDTVMQDIKQGAQNMSNDVKEAMHVNHDSNFMVKVTVANNEEMMLLKSGLSDGTSKELKAHARMMMTDHKKLGAKIKEMAAKANYPLPENDNGNADDVIAKLNTNTKGADWDKAWVDKMMDKHNDAISEFEKAQDKVNDADLKTLITNTLPTLHSHYDMLQQLHDKMNK